MLSTFLGQLQGYFSKYFILAAFFPMLSFAVLNGLVGYLVFDVWRAWIDQNILAASLGSGTFVTTSLIVAVTLLAYVQSGLSTFLRQVLEGRSISLLANLFVPSQNRRREALVNELQSVAMEMADLSDATNWQSQMKQARDDGKRNHPGVPYPPPDPDPLDHALRKLEIKRSGFDVVEAAALEASATEIANRFRNCDFDASPGLLRQQQKLGALIAYAKERAPARNAKLQNELNSNFGTQDVAPTKMGNVANSMQSYALRRYHCNLEMLWTNLMRVVQKDDKAQAALMEAKTQLDFLVACCWLTLICAVFWMIVFSVFAPSRLAFLVFSLLGPLMAYIWYRAAAEQYRSFADVAMTTFDSLRFDLLSEMHIHLPADVEEERFIWENVDNLTTFGESRNFRYVPPKA